MKSPDLPLGGSCLCGAVRMEITAVPMMTLACHCRDCQKLCASAYSLTAMIPADGFSTSGVDPVIGGLRSAQRRHHYCPECMTFLFTRIRGAEHRVNVRATLLDELSWFVPFVEVMTKERLPWVSLPARHSFATLPASREAFGELLAEYETATRGTA